jgi:hypothetical protein
MKDIDLLSCCIEEEVHMKCCRCGGMMVSEKFYDHAEHFFGWRCICCGDIVDR